MEGALGAWKKKQNMRSHYSAYGDIIHGTTDEMEKSDESLPWKELQGALGDLVPCPTW